MAEQLTYKTKIIPLFINGSSKTDRNAWIEYTYNPAVEEITYANFCATFNVSKQGVLPPQETLVELLLWSDKMADLCVERISTGEITRTPLARDTVTNSNNENVTVFRTQLLAYSPCEWDDTTESQDDYIYKWLDFNDISNSGYGVLTWTSNNPADSASRINVADYFSGLIDSSKILNYDDLHNSRRTVWTLYMDSNQFYLTWDCPFVSEKLENNYVMPEDVIVQYESVTGICTPTGNPIQPVSITDVLGGFFNHDGEGGTQQYSEYPYMNEPYCFNISTLIKNYKGAIEKALNYVTNNFQLGSTYNPTLQFRLKWRESDASGTYTEYTTSWCYVAFYGKFALSSMLKKLDGKQIRDYVNYYTDGENIVASDESYVVLKDGLPTDDPAYEQENENDFLTDDDYTVEDIESDELTDTTKYTVLGRLTKTYALTEGRVDALGHFLWASDFIDRIKQINNSPMENIIALKAFPFGMTGTDENIYLGNVDSEIKGARIQAGYDPTYNVGSVRVEGVYNSFLDYPPFTRCYIHLPFLGIEEIDLAVCMGNRLYVSYVPDLITGIASINLYLDDGTNKTLYATYSAQMGIDIPLSATNNGQVTGAIMSNLAHSALTVAGTMALSKTAGAVKAVGVASGIVGGLESATAQHSVSTSGAGSADCWGRMDRNCYLIYDRPTYQDIAKFNHTYGRKCNLSRVIGSLRGYTEINTIDLTNMCIATSDEAEELKQILASGFYA